MGRAKCIVTLLLTPFLLAASGIRAALPSGLHFTHASTGLVDGSLNSPAMRLNSLNPLGLGVVAGWEAVGGVLVRSGELDRQWRLEVQSCASP